MIILGIETSCDDTCAAVVKTCPNGEKNNSPFQPGLAEGRFKILSNVISSQIKVHKKYGGVFPSLAKREHQKNLAPVVSRAIKTSKIKTWKHKEDPKITEQKEKEIQDILERDKDFLRSTLVFLKKAKKPQIDAIALTVGPGLEPSLWQGINFARAISLWWDMPIIPVNHIEGHILANFTAGQKSLPKNLEDLFPAVCLVASGGHTQLVLMEGIGKYRTLGESRDDAAGECLDKTARILGLDYPGGPIIYKIAKNFKPEKSEITAELPRPMIFSKNYDFSFSGLKTAVLYEFKKQKPDIQKSKKYIQAMAYEIQRSIIDILVRKTLKAADAFKARSIIVGGGVTANENLKKRFLKETAGLDPRPLFLSPAKDLSTDNAVMICAAALFNRDKITGWKDLRADANLRIK